MLLRERSDPGVRGADTDVAAALLDYEIVWASETACKCACRRRACRGEVRPHERAT